MEGDSHEPPAPDERMNKSAFAQGQYPALRLLVADEVVPVESAAVATEAPRRLSTEEGEALAHVGWFALLSFDLPAQQGYALHPGSVRYINAGLDGRYPLVSRGRYKLIVGYAIEGSTADDLVSARTTAHWIAHTIGLAPESITRVKIKNLGPISG